MDLRVLIYTCHPEPWEWVSPRDGEHESRERRDVVVREDMLIMRQHLTQAQRSVAAHTYSRNEGRTGKNQLGPPAGGWLDLLALSCTPDWRGHRGKKEFGSGAQSRGDTGTRRGQWRGRSKLSQAELKIPPGSPAWVAGRATPRDGCTFRNQPATLLTVSASQAGRG